MRVVVFPQQILGNPYFQDFLAGLRAAGLQDVRLSRVLQFKSTFEAMHFHHPEHVVTQGGLLKAIISAVAVLSVASYAKLTSRPIIWMVHDVEPAWIRRKLLLSLYMKAFTKLTTAYVFLNASSQKRFYAKTPSERRKPYRFAPHTRYQTILRASEARERLRKTHGVEPGQLLLSFLGQIKGYKGLDCAALLPQMTSSGMPVKIAICGSLDHVLPPTYVDDAMKDRPAGSYIRLDRHLTDDEMALWIQSSDAVILSYQTGSNSGMAFNVLSNHGRIISSDLPMFTELADRVGESWIRCVDINDSDAIERAVDEVERGREREPDFDRLAPVFQEGDPTTIGVMLGAFYRELRARRSLVHDVLSHDAT